MIVIGINAFHADAAAAAVVGGRFVTGVEEERFTRVKHWAGFPAQALKHCLSEVNGGSAEGVQAFAVARQPAAYLWRKAVLAIRNPRSLVRALDRVRNLSQVRSLERRLAHELGICQPLRVCRVEHHLAHAASSFFCSSFEEAACLTVDGFGDFTSTMLARGRGNKLEVLQRVHFPHSLGLLYTAITQYLGFQHYGDEYKVMGLAAYGEPRFCAEIRRMVDGLSDGTFQLDLRYFRHLAEGVEMNWEAGEPRVGRVYTPAVEELLGPGRHPEDEILQRHKDLAASLQQVYEERFFALVRQLLKRTGLKQLALAGGCGFNSLANGRLLENTDVEEVYVQPAAGDAGTALGAALYVHHVLLGGARGFVMDHASWGPQYDERAVRTALADRICGSDRHDGAYGEYHIVTVVDEERLTGETAAAVAQGDVVGWYQGRGEWGPRALGNRSILADPRRANMREVLNLKIKRREPFRPFAPSILEERTSAWFTIGQPDPFMTKVYPIRAEKRPLIPSVTHVDGTGRLQTVSRSSNLRYWKVIHAFERLTGIPIVLNTSFNENEPIVNTPAEALDCFLRTKMDRLVMGNIVITRRSSVEALAASTNGLPPR